MAEPRLGRGSTRIVPGSFVTLLSGSLFFPMTVFSRASKTGQSSREIAEIISVSPPQPHQGIRGAGREFRLDLRQGKGKDERDAAAAGL